MITKKCSEITFAPLSTTLDLFSNFLVNDLIGKSHAVNITSINMGDYELLEVEFDQNLSRGVYLVQYELNGKTETYQLLVE